MPMPKKPNFAQFNYMLGTWSCTSKSSRRTTPQRMSITWSRDPSGYWFVGRGIMMGTPWFPHGSSGVDMIGYDYDAKRWVDVYTDSLGNYDLAASKGMAGKKMVWHSLVFTPTADMLSVTDQTMVKLSPTKTLMYYGFTAKGGRKVTVTGTCTKQPI